jgi:hypothetical protein
MLKTILYPPLLFGPALQVDKARSLPCLALSLKLQRKEVHMKQEMSDDKRICSERINLLEIWNFKT